MLAILFLWIIIFFVSFTMGEALVGAYNNWAKERESYNIFECVLLGLSGISIVLMFYSLFMPSNHYFTIGLVVISVLYWILNKEKTSKYLELIKIELGRWSFLQIISITTILLVILSASTWVEGIYDANYYHHQNIAWNEKYRIIPGLGNIEDRYAFNSNYMLLSAIFSFTAWFGQPIFALQSFLIACFSVWIINELFKSKFDVLRAVVLIGFAFFYLLNIKNMLDTSTDILPNLLILYLVAKIIFYPDSLRQSKLFFILIPAFLITCKLSVFPIMLLSFYLFYILLKEKNYKGFNILIGLCLLMGMGWGVRNVIISGYLVYPFYAIDLFSFDWKMPIEIAKAQTEYIKDIGVYYFNVVIKNPAMNKRDPTWVSKLNILLLGLAVISTFLSGVVLLIKQKKVKQSVVLLFIALLLILLLWYPNGADPRFVQGAMIGVLVLFASLLLKIKPNKYIAYASLLIFIVPIFIWSSMHIRDKYNLLHNPGNPIRGKGFWTTLYEPYSYIDFVHSIGIAHKEKLHTLELIDEKMEFYVGVLGFTFHKFPAVIGMEHDGKFCNYKLLQLRGDRVEDGFRLKQNKRTD